MWYKIKTELLCKTLQTKRKLGFHGDHDLLSGQSTDWVFMCLNRNNLEFEICVLNLNYFVCYN